MTRRQPSGSTWTRNPCRAHPRRNRTAARLEHLLPSQRAFAGEASHQLKTPLAALRLRLENLEPDTAQRARGSLTAAVTETDRLSRMVEGLLAMARLEDSAAAPDPVDVGEICAERHRTWAPLFKRHDVSLVLFAGSVGQVLAIPGAVEQILDNLLSNALGTHRPAAPCRWSSASRHPPAGSPCTISTTSAKAARPGSTCTSRTRAPA